MSGVYENPEREERMRQEIRAHLVSRYAMSGVAADTMLDTIQAYAVSMAGETLRDRFATVAPAKTPLGVKGAECPLVPARQRCDACVLVYRAEQDRIAEAIQRSVRP